MRGRLNQLQGIGNCFLSGRSKLIGKGMNKKKFDRQQVLESAMLLFWQKGYHQVSTRDLQNLTNLKTGSLYCAF